MYSIAIVGAGQIGSRHLQACAMLELAATIHVCDISENSLAVAKKRFEEVGNIAGEIKVKYHSAIDELPKDIDIAIIATDAKQRYAITKELLTKINLRSIIFEKVVFQSKSQFQEIKSLLDEAKIKAWVNCPRRMYPLYKSIRNTLHGENRIYMSVAGGEWGLGCNSIHFLDLFSYLTSSTELFIDTTRLDNNILTSKRSGYKEFSGSLFVSGANGSRLQLFSMSNSDLIVQISIMSESMAFIIDEKNGLMKWNRKDNGWKNDLTEFTTPFQSQLTDIAINQILNEGSCELTDYESSMMLHFLLIDSLNDFIFRKTGESLTVCPIS